jgi:hypothetical protein
MVNSHQLMCRYDHPFTFSGDLQQRNELKQCLQRLQEKGVLLAICKNKADQVAVIVSSASPTRSLRHGLFCAVW